MDVKKVKEDYCNFLRYCSYLKKNYSDANCFSSYQTKPMLKDMEKSERFFGKFEDNTFSANFFKTIYDNLINAVLENQTNQYTHVTSNFFKNLRSGTQHNPFEPAPCYIRLKDYAWHPFSVVIYYWKGEDNDSIQLVIGVEGKKDNFDGNDTKIYREFLDSHKDASPTPICSVTDNSTINSDDIFNLIKTNIDKAIKNYEELLSMIPVQPMTVLENSKALQIVLTGAPGTGKTYAVKKFVEGKNHEFVQFHPSYDYTDFVEGLRPVEQNGETIFVRMDGTFKEFCRKAAKDEDDNIPYYFVIDEINRADLGKVFGELMSCLEEGHRGVEEGVVTQYANLPTYHINKEGKLDIISNDIYKQKFYIPKNVHIIGTMNDIDRSVESIDFAMRRRFTWIEIKANEVMTPVLSSMISYKNGKSKLTDNIIVNLSTSIQEMNDVISGSIGKKLGLSEQYHIGPAYFKELTEIQVGNEKKKIGVEYSNQGDLDAHIKKFFIITWTNKVEPLLREYCRGKNTEDVGTLINECRKVFESTKYIESNNDNTDLINRNSIKDYLDKGEKQIIFTGAPGTGKTFGVKEWLKNNSCKYEIVQFHPSYDYTDFIEGLRPVTCIDYPLNSIQTDEDVHSKENILPKKNEIEKISEPSFVKVDGVFKKFCRKAANDNEKTPYYFVIDEINRADLSKVFGELMFGMEDDKRGEENSFTTQYSNLDTYIISDSDGKANKLENKDNVFWNEKKMKEMFFIPKNVHIIGIMNDIDRNVESIDFALRRRFTWVDIKANDVMKTILDSMLVGKCEDVNGLAERVKILNNEVISKKGKQFSLNDSYHIGPAVLKYYNEIDSTPKEARKYVWNHSILPIIREYCRGKNAKDVEEFIEEGLRVFVEE